MPEQLAHRAHLPYIVSMDTITHAVSGALVYKGLSSFIPLPKTPWAVPLVMLAAASPDVDIFFAPTPVDFLLLHRGITHALAALPIMACLLALLLYPLWRKATVGHWSFGATALFGAGLVLMHIWLDCVTSYGTMIFLPFSDYRVRLNGLFIVDIWLLIPMLLGLIWGKSGKEAVTAQRPQPLRRALLLGACAWILLYPATAVLWRMQVEAQEIIGLVTQNPQGLTVLPDALAPRHWRVMYQTDGLPKTPQTALQAPMPDALSDPDPAQSAQGRSELPRTPALASSGFSPYNTVHQQGLNALAAPTTPVYNYPAANENMTRWLAGQDVSCRVFFGFTLLPLQYQQAWEDGMEYAFYDLRFASLVPFVEKIMSWRRGGQVPFLLRVRLNAQGEVQAVRMILSGGNRDSGWQAPQAPRKPDLLHWLVGLQ